MATFLVTAASGNIGGHLIPQLLAHPSKPTLVLPTSSASKLSAALGSSASSEQVRIVEGNITEPLWIESLCAEHSVTAAFVCLTGDGELIQTLNFFHALTRSPSVKHLVYLSACGDMTLSAIERGVLKPNFCGHANVKYILEAKLRHGMKTPEEGGLTWTILGPALFFSNDMHSKQPLMSPMSMFGVPAGTKGVSRVALGDIAACATAALVDGGKQMHGKKIHIGSKKRYTSQDIGALWSKALGKEIKVVTSDEKGLSMFEGIVTKFMGPAWARDMRCMYTWFEEDGFGMTDENYKELCEVLGRESESYDEFVSKTAEQWKKEAAAGGAPA